MGHRAAAAVQEAPCLERRRVVEAGVGIGKTDGWGGFEDILGFVLLRLGRGRWNLNGDLLSRFGWKNCWLAGCAGGWVVCQSEVTNLVTA